MTYCRNCSEPHPIVAQGMMTYGQGGKGKGKKRGSMGYPMATAMYAKGKCSQGTRAIWAIRAIRAIWAIRAIRAIRAIWKWTI